MLKLDITNQHHFERAIVSGSFKVATHVWLYNLPLVAALPDMLNATDVWLDNLPLLAESALKNARRG